MSTDVPNLDTNQSEINQNSHPSDHCHRSGVKNCQFQSMDVRIKQLETCMFQNLYLMTMGGSQTNVQIQQQANLLHNLQICLQSSLFPPRPIFPLGGVGNAQFIPLYMNLVYPNAGSPLNVPYVMPHNIPQTAWQPQLVFDTEYGDSATECQTLVPSASHTL